MKRRRRVTGLRLLRSNPASKKLYVAVAQSMDVSLPYLSDAERRGAVAVLIMLAKHFKADNKNFNTLRFLNACGLKGRELGVAAGQVNPRRRRMHSNPTLVTFGNPMRLMSNDVVEIKYQHAEDSKFYYHKFRRKQVQLFGSTGGKGVAVLKRVDGKPLLGEY